MNLLAEARISIQIFIGAVHALSILAGALVVLSAHAAQPERLLADFARGQLMLEPANGPCILLDVYIAADSKTRAQGLMSIEELGEYEGMLFVYGRSALISMWMKNTLIPLDMLFIRDDLTIAKIAAHTTPLSLDTIPSEEPVSSVLELNADSARRWGLQAGDRIRPVISGAE